jgi:hypothetical protein
MVGRDPRHETRLWSIGVVTLDPRERSIGERLGACGVVGTAVRYERRPRGSGRFGATTASAKAQEPSSSGPAANMRARKADGRGGRTDDWRPVGASPRPPSKPTRPRHGSTSKRPPSSTRQRHIAAWPPPISAGPRCRGERRTPGRRWGISARQNCGWRNRLVPTASRRASRACVEDHLRPVTGGTYGSRCRRLGSPQSSERFQRRHRGARRNRQGDGDTAEGSVFGGVRRPREWSPGTGVRSGRWRCRSGARLPTACDPSASLPRPAPSRPERAWPFGYPARSSAGPPGTNQQPSCTVYLSRASSPRSSLWDP